MLIHGGFPPQLWHAYYAFHSNVVYHNSVAGMLGRPHRHPLGIPQGCPFSMTFIAFMLVPWARSMLSIGCIPRALADDILVTAKGDQHELLFLRGYTITLLYFHIIGARIAFTKCFLFSTCTTTRARLQNHVWPIINCSINVVLHYRDLGAHICRDLTTAWLHPPCVTDLLQGMAFAKNLLTLAGNTVPGIAPSARLSSPFHLWLRSLALSPCRNGQTCNFCGKEYWPIFSSFF